MKTKENIDINTSNMINHDLGFYKGLFVGVMLMVFIIFAYKLYTLLLQ